MKKLLLFSFILAPLALAMEMPEITYEGPQPTCHEGETEINARDKECDAIGWIIYECSSDKTAKISVFEVDDQFKNKGIGQQLFQQCINDVVEKHCTRIEWNVVPLHTINAATLCTIYGKIVKKLKNSESYRLTQQKLINNNSTTIKMVLHLS